MISLLRKINRTKNYILKRHKLKIKLNLLSTLSFRRKQESNNPPSLKHIVLPFISKGIGDAIVISGIISTLVKNDYKVSVIADKRTHFLFEEWKMLHNLYLFEPTKKNELIKELKKCEPFIFIDSHEITYSNVETFSLMRRIKPASTIGFHKKYKIYDHIVNFTNPLGHVSTRYTDLLDFLGITTSKSYDYSVCIPEKNKLEAFDFIKALKGRKIVTFIPYGSVSERLFTKEQINAILDYFSQYKNELHVVIIGEQNKIKDIKENENVSKNTYPSFFTAAQLIKESELVISPDTSIVHLARAFQRKMICIYPFKILINGADNADTWGPNYDLAVQMRLKERRIMDADVNIIIKTIDAEISYIRETAD